MVIAFFLFTINKFEIVPVHIFLKTEKLQIMLIMLSYSWKFVIFRIISYDIKTKKTILNLARINSSHHERNYSLV